MNRKIKFRAKRKDNNQWIEGGYSEHDGKVFIVTWARYIPDTRDWDTAEYYENNPHYNSTLIEVIPETVCQYTGLTDKNGGKIFEGDIVKDTALHTIGKVFYWEYEGRFAFDDVNDDAQFYTGDMWEDCEVIGNIFDNPELTQE